MAKSRSATSLVALALLGCLVGTKVAAQDWHKPASGLTKGFQPPPAPYVPPPPPPPPPPPKFPQYPQPPPVQPPPSPKFPQYPQPPPVQPPPPPKFPQHPQPPPVQPPPPPKFPQYPQPPPVQPPPPPPKRPQYPQPPPVQPPPPPPKRPQYPQPPPVQPPPPPPKRPQYPQPPPVQPPPPPKFPQHPQPPPVQPAQPPKYPKHASMSYDQSPQVPQSLQPQRTAQIPSIHKPSGAKQPPVQSCDVAANMRIPCGVPDISAAGCEAINCCFDGQNCYFGKAVTVQCTKDAQFIVVVARDATLPHIDLESISLLGQGQSCAHVDSNSEFAIYQFPVTSCGSVVMEEPGVIIYENRMSSAYEVGVGDLGAITRDSSFELLFQCRYIGTSVETVVVEVLKLENPPLPAAAMGPIRVHLRLANGECATKGCNEVDAAYTSYYTEADYPVTKVLRDPVYVEVQLLEKTDPNLILTLGRCWTTTSSNPHSLPQWDILIDGCPYKDDNYLSELVPVGQSSGLEFPSHYRRFIFKMFTFVDNSMEPLKEQVYIHCSTAVCTAAPGRNCEPSCFRRQRRDVVAEQQVSAEPKIVVSSGPLMMSAPEE